MGRVSKNNTLAVKHGAHSSNPVIPADLEDELIKARDFITSQPQVCPQDLIIVNLVVQHYKMIRLMEIHAEKTGYFLTDEAGNIFPKACFATLYVALTNALSRNLDRLGMTPQSRQQLGLTKQKKDFISWLNQKEGMKDVKQATDR